MPSKDPAHADSRRQLAAEKAAARRRVHASRAAARALATWVDPTLATDQPQLATAATRWLARLGEENVRRLAMRTRRMADWEQLRAERMRDAGASDWTLLKYAGAEQDMVIDGPPCRDTIYTETLQGSMKRGREKGREALLKAAIPTAVIATVATLATAGVGYVAGVAAPFLGGDAQFWTGCWEQWQTVFLPILNKAESVATDFDVASGGAMFALGAFWMWAHDSRLTEDLRVKAAQKEVPALDQGIGFPAKSHRIQAAIRAIPSHQRILLAHLSSTDLRSFLLSTDDERIHLLRENRPPLVAQFKSILATHPRVLSSLGPAIRDIADVCMPKRWARALGVRHPGEIGPELMQAWRAPKNSLSPVDEVDVAALGLPRVPHGTANAPEPMRRAGRQSRSA